MIPLVHRLSFLCCASALPNPGFSKLLVLEVIEHSHQYRCGYSMRCTNISAFANLNTAAWMLKERGVMGAPVTGKMRIRLQTKHCKIVDSSFVSFVLLILIFFTRWYHSDWRSRTVQINKISNSILQIDNLSTPAPILQDVFVPIPLYGTCRRCAPLTVSQRVLFLCT